MIDLKKLREDPQGFKNAVARKGYELDIDALLKLDEKRRALIQEIDELRNEANEVASLGKDADRERGKELKEKIKISEKQLEEINDEIKEVWFDVNPPFEDVPDNDREVRVVGEKTLFDFEPKDHLELGKTLDTLDFETGAKVAGSQFYYLKNEGALLELALIQYAVEALRENGFDIFITPDLARERFYKGTGFLPGGPEAQTYEVADTDLGLIATAEVTLAGYHADEILDAEKLPLKYAGVSHCFRKEAGSYGKYSKGLYRVHQFSKVEMYAFTKPEDSSVIHEEFLKIEEEIFDKLGIPYRVIEVGAKNLSAQSARTYDIEAWMPGRNDWGEVTSTSNTTDFQAHQLSIRYKTKNRIDLLHTLNGTAIATSRAMIAILENFQQKDGSVKIPKALHKYLPFKKIKLKSLFYV